VKKRTEIMIEFDEVMVVSARPDSVQAWCEQCCLNVLFVTPEQSSVVAGVSVRTINHWVEAGIVHFVETPNGLLFVCVESLRFAESRRRV